MTYAKPEITNATETTAALKSQGASKAQIVPDSVSPLFPYATSAAYDADE